MHVSPSHMSKSDITYITELVHDTRESCAERGWGHFGEEDWYLEVNVGGVGGEEKKKVRASAKKMDG